MERDQRTETLTVRLSESELKLIDNLRDKRQLTNKGKVSRADVIVQAVKFVTGAIILNK